LSGCNTIPLVLTDDKLQGKAGGLRQTLPSRISPPHFLPEVPHMGTINLTVMAFIGPVRLLQSLIQRP
jgi:hypothetical protein